MTPDSIVAITLLTLSALSSAFFVYTHALRRQTYLILWSIGWCLLALHYLSRAVSPWVAAAPWESAVSQWLLGGAGLLFFGTARAYSEKRPLIRLQIAASVFFLFWVAAFYLHKINAAPELGVAAVLLGTAWVFFSESHHGETLADLLLAISFFLWGAIMIGELFASPGVVDSLRAMEILPQLSAAVLMVMALYEKEKRHVESNILALSNINLEACFAGTEIPKMLSDAMERVLGVVRMPSGALMLHHGTPESPTSVVAVGLPDDFCTALREENLDGHLVHMISRLGGSAVFRELDRNTPVAALENEPCFKRFRELAVDQRFRTIIGISLQAKGQVFGAMFLATPDRRRFKDAELRLLLALAHQIGVSVENSYLMEQISRRSEEFHVLNEIGRTLSSTLDVDKLFETIVTGMKRLVDVDHFYIALHDRVRNEIHFEAEVREGLTQPKRVRLFDDRHVTEHVITTGQPLLIRDHYADEMRKLGLNTRFEHGCYCGVPLLLNGRAIGVMALEHPQEGVFGTSHLETMRVLAGEVVIALENARLFREERTKSGHLTLLNNISRNVIATFNPDEMLFNIARELEQSQNFSHIGIGLLDYSNKEIVIHAEAGRRKGVFGRRLGWDGNIVGLVARTGQMTTLSYPDASAPPCEPLLEGSLFAIGMPLVYADQLNGVLYVEDDRSSELPEEEIRFLSTLTDLISGALHNALAFQKAQEQAITDGLTSVKTHRFFMEALTAEWKRSTRANRSFSVVLMDLDRFKFVNDFYGHLAGDDVLKRVGRILDQNCRRSDVVARYGGDEFVILMPETDAEHSYQIATKIRSWVAADPALQEKNVTASLGVANFPLHGATPQELIQVADASMYLSKHQGGNTVSTADHFNPEDSKQWKRDVLEAYLSVTLKRLFATGPDAFTEICGHIEQFARSLADAERHMSGADEVPEAKTSASPFERLPLAVLDTLMSLALAVDARDQFTQGHSQKVSVYAVMMAEALGLNSSETEEIRLASMLHDLGKVGVLDSILNKSGPLNPDEWETMKRHAEYGAKLLEPLRGTERLRQILAHHHEFYDGSGYPDGISGGEIPLGSRIISIADAYDTITSERTYKKARNAEEAFRELERCSGVQFDPDLVQLFLTRLRSRSKPTVEIELASERETLA